MLPAVLAAAAPGTRRWSCPTPNADEAALVDRIEVLAVRHAELNWSSHLFRAGSPSRDTSGGGCRHRLRCPISVTWSGRPAGQRAVEILAGGGHHLLMTGPPGAGKTMLAERLPGLLPPLDEQAALKVSAIHLIAGTLPPDAPLVHPANI